jgi:sarcosine oxidase, subunit beta
MILDGATPTPVAPFSIGRFRRGVAVSDKIAREFETPTDRA